MPNPYEIVQWYKKNDIPLLCFYCGSKDIGTKDHLEPKSRVPEYIRRKRYKMKSKNPSEYYNQFVLCCVRCNRMKADCNVNEFFHHIKKIVEWNREHKIGGVDI